MTGMKFNHGYAEMDRSLYLPGVWFDEQADPDIGLLQLADEICQPVMLASGIESAFGRPFFAFFGNDTCGTGFVTQRNVEHFIRCSHFQVERNG